MKHYGDITKINGYMTERVNVVIGGSPCQDLSVAGKRAGLAGARSGLFMEQIRIIREMREADEASGRTGADMRPRFMVWENVPGAFSSNGGADFGAVLQETVRVVEPEAPAVPMPRTGWPMAGCLSGARGDWSVAWRVLDAQFWGVPQRRRRIALVADFNGRRAPEILFERESVPWDYPPCGTSREGIAADAERCVGYAIQGFGGYKRSDVVSCQTSRQYKDATDLIVFAQNQRDEVRDLHDKAGALSAQAGMKQQTYIAFTNRGHASGETAETLRAESHGALPMVCSAAGFKGGQSEKACSIGYAVEQAPTLSADGSHLDPTVFCIQGNCIDRADTARCNGSGWKENQSYTLNTIDRPAVVYDARGNGSGHVAPALIGDHENRVTDYTALIRETESGSHCGYCVRRMTPLECERLQGFPDGWTDIGPWVDSKGKLHAEVTDSHRYKALGNSIALPPWMFVLQRLNLCCETDHSMASLFDGIGGFPLIWEWLNGPGLCVWASEIEEFPIAVTMHHFPEIH